MKVLGSTSRFYRRMEAFTVTEESCAPTRQATARRSSSSWGMMGTVSDSCCCRGTLLQSQQRVFQRAQDPNRSRAQPFLLHNLHRNTWVTAAPTVFRETASLKPCSPYLCASVAAMVIEFSWSRVEVRKIGHISAALWMLWGEGVGDMAPLERICVSDHSLLYS